MCAVVTVFEPDVERQGEPFDYVEELLLNPDNNALEIEQRQPERSVIGKKHPNTPNESPLFDQIVPQNLGYVKHRFSREIPNYLQEENERIHKELQDMKRKYREKQKQKDYWKDEATRAPILDRDDVRAVTEFLLSSYYSKVGRPRLSV